MLTDPLADNESEGDLSAGRSNKLLQSTQSIVNPAELDESLLMYEKQNLKNVHFCQQRSYLCRAWAVR